MIFDEKSVNLERFYFNILKTMKKTLLLLLSLSSLVFAQQKEITLEDIWVDGTFRAERLNAFHSMSSGDYYTILNTDNASNNSSLDKYDYKTQAKVATLINSADFNELA